LTALGFDGVFDAARGGVGAVLTGDGKLHLDGAQLWQDHDGRIVGGGNAVRRYIGPAASSPSDKSDFLEALDRPRRKSVTIEV